MKKIYWISYLRVVAMCSIVLCHLVAQAPLNIVRFTAQFFNVGVEIFFMISGFLFGMKKINENWSQWYKKRIKRIVVPVYTFLGILLIVHILKGNNINISNWIKQLFMLQGLESYVNGAEHLWFLTVLLFCYLITPLLDYIRKNFDKKSISLLYIGCILVQVITTFFISRQMGIYLMKVNLYILSYIIGSFYYKMNISNKLTFISLLVCCFAIASRVIGKILVDGTLLYDVFIVGITQSLIAFSLLFIFARVLKNIKSTPKLINYFDTISYEVYLVHYMFIIGPISLMTMTGSYIINCLIVIIISILLASVVHVVSNKIIKSLNK